MLYHILLLVTFIKQYSMNYDLCQVSSPVTFHPKEKQGIVST